MVLRDLVTQGNVALEQRRLPEALQAFRQALSIQPDNHRLYFQVGVIYYQLGQPESTLTAMQRAVELRPDMFEMNAPLGATLYALGDDPAAYRVLSHAHELNPQNAEVAGFLFKVALSLGQSSVRKQDYAGAVGYLRKAADLHPEDPETHLRLADAYSLLGDPSKAEAEREQARRLDHAGH